MTSRDRLQFSRIEILENKTFSPDAIDDKSVVFDVRAVLQGKTKVNVEVQLRNQHNMDKRSLFYWGKEFTKSLKKGQDYINLPRVIAINIVDYEFLPVKNYHSCFHIREDTENIILTDALEIHFLDMVKYRKQTGLDLRKMPLNRWLTWFNRGRSPKPLAEVVKMEAATQRSELLEEIIKMDPAIQAAEKRLSELVEDEETQRAIWRRQMAITDYKCAIDYARDEGRADSQTEIARNLKKMGLSVDQISQATGLSPETIEQL
jgi:predicted transposase/invertase (TIGR01784 family)